MNFNKEKFSEILVKIKDSYGSINQMAEKTGITTAYLSKLIRLMYDNAPSPRILAKIAKASKGITSYEELMTICGHIKENDFDSYLLGMLGLTEQDMIDFDNSLKEINLTDYEEKIYRNIIEKMRNEIAHNNKDFKLDILEYIKNEHQETQSKIITALNLYDEYFKKMSNFASIMSNKKDTEEDTLEIRAIARDVAKLKPEKKELFKNLLKQMSDEADEASKR